MKRLMSVYVVMFLMTLQASHDYRTLFENKHILITGGTGFIGRALIEEILPYNPAKLVIFSRDEVKHYKLLEDFKDPRIVSVIGDVRDYNSIYNATKGMDIVIHAAALKRIDMLEYHVYEAIHTNVLGSLNVARACAENNVSQALLVSTDKACMPINAYGACKFLAEKLFTNGSINKRRTVFLAVRYGNVLQSTGSAIPFFCEKIRNNEKIPLTDVHMTRFFIAKKQAVELIFKALLYGKDGELFVPELPAFKIVDLIRVLQDKLGNVTDIEIIGLRPGEKIHEAMISDAEASRVRKLHGAFVVVPTIHIENHNVESIISSEYTSEGAVLPLEALGLLLEKYEIVL